MTKNDRILLRAEWEKNRVDPPVVGTVRNSSGPNKSWLSICLSGESGMQLFLHCRRKGTGFECACRRSPDRAVEWRSAGDLRSVRAAMLEFREEFVADLRFFSVFR